MPDIMDLFAVTAPDFRTGPAVAHKVSRALWLQAAGALAQGRLTLLGLWASPPTVTMALLNEDTRRIGVVCVDARRGSFPSVGRLHPAAQRPERAIADLFGITPEATPDGRPWLDHGHWGVCHPMGEAKPVTAPQAYPFSRVLNAPFCPWKAKACIRSRSARSMPESSSRATFVLLFRVKPSCGWNNGWATPIKAWPA